MMDERRVAQEALFYEFSLERHVPADYLLHAIDRVVDLSGLRARLRPFYSGMGRPSIDPELVVRMLIVGYCFGIRSERRLCDEVHLNLAYRCFCRLGLEGAVPDHSTFSKNRHGRFRDSDLLRELFDTTVRRCIDERWRGLRGRLEPGPGRRQSAALYRGIGGGRLGRSRPDPAVGARLSRHAGPSGLGCRQRGHAEVRVPVRPGRAMDGRAERARLLRLRHEIPDRPRSRRHRRRRGMPRHPAG